MKKRDGNVRRSCVVTGGQGITGGVTRKIRREQYTSSARTTREDEEYIVNLRGVTALKSGMRPRSARESCPGFVDPAADCITSTQARYCGIRDLVSHFKRIAGRSVHTCRLFFFELFVSLSRTLPCLLLLPTQEWTSVLREGPFPVPPGRRLDLSSVRCIPSACFFTSSCQLFKLLPRLFA